MDDFDKLITFTQNIIKMKHKLLPGDILLSILE